MSLIDEIDKLLSAAEYAPDAIIARDKESAIAFENWWAWRSTQAEDLSGRAGRFNTERSTVERS